MSGEFVITRVVDAPFEDGREGMTQGWPGTFEQFADYLTDQG